MSEKKWVYLFSEGSETMRNLLGGKGAGVSEMTRAGLPVPPGFTITTEACIEYLRENKFPAGMWDQVLTALKEVEKQTGKKFGDAANPLLVSVRSGARVSMPGMMDTVLNVGLNDSTVEGIARLTNNERFAYDAYRRLIQLFGRIVKGVDGEKFDRILNKFKAQTAGGKDTDLSVDQLKAIVKEYKALYKQEVGEDFPNDPLQQLHQAAEAVFGSWFGKRAVDYRNYNKIPHDWGTAVNVQTMVFGNMGEDSGTGVAFTRNPSTGERKLYGEYLLNAQGEDVVAGIRTPNDISVLQKEMPEVFDQFVKITQQLEQHYREMQDMEFTIERGKLWMLQTRRGQRTAKAAVKIAVDMVHEGLIDKEEAVVRVTTDQVDQLLHPVFDDKAKSEARARGDLLAKGLNASPGAASGIAVMDATRAAELAEKGEAVVLVRPETSPEDIHGMLVAQGVLTQHGGATSHAAVVARGLNKPCVAGTESIDVDVEHRVLRVDGRTLKEGEPISIDGTTGEVFAGRIPTMVPKYEEQTELVELLGYANEIKRLGVYTNADYPRDARAARNFGAEGIGLCRTEHMFFEEERRPIVQKMVLLSNKASGIFNRMKSLQDELLTATGARADEINAELEKLQQDPNAKEYMAALDQLLQFQRSDFVGIFEAMDGLPVIIRLIDPPMHEFLPTRDVLIRETTELRCTGENPQLLAEKEDLLRTVEAMHEVNPMLGLRGCRVGIMYYGMTEMQTRAIIEAACDCTRRGIKVYPEIMIPLVSHVNELKNEQVTLERVAKQVLQEQGVELEYQFGTMIEIPRAALTADEIAEYAQFFSFGTNDLTQMTFGISRDDAEGKFLLAYVEKGILPRNPFQGLDRTGVGKLMKMGVELGRKTRPGMSIGICGEHGGDPDAIHFCHEINLNYVSCSPYRVPVARIAAAHAAIEEKRGQQFRDK